MVCIRIICANVYDLDHYISIWVIIIIGIYPFHYALFCLFIIQKNK